MEQYFHALSEDDVSMLQDTSEDFSPFLIPASSRTYTDIWREEDEKLVKLDPTMMTYPSIYREPVELIEQDSTVVPGEFTLGSLTERILSSLLEEKLIPSTAADDDGDEMLSAQMMTGPRSSWDSEVLEERIKRELFYLGLLSEKDVRISLFFLLPFRLYPYPNLHPLTDLTDTRWKSRTTKPTNSLSNSSICKTSSAASQTTSRPGNNVYYQ